MGNSPSTQRVYDKFEDVKAKFENELKGRANEFQGQVYDLTMNKVKSISSEVSAAISQDIAVVKAEIKPEDLDKANADAANESPLNVKPPTDHNGQPIDLKAKPSKNDLIVLYNDQNMIVQQSEKTDFSGLKESIAKITKAVAGTFPKGVDPDSAGGMLASLATNPAKVAESINTVVSGVLGMSSTSANVGVNSHANVQYVPPGIYVGCLTFSSAVQMENKWGTNSVVMWLVKTIVCTSTHLMNTAVVRAQVSEKLDMNRMARLNVVQSLGKVIGVADAADYGATIFMPVDTTQLVQSVEAAKQSAAKHPAGEAPGLQDLDQPRIFEKAIQWKDQKGKAEGWDVVLQMYEALKRMHEKSDEQKFMQFAMFYQKSIDRLSGQVKDKYRMLRDELKQEEENLMQLLRSA